MPIKAKRQRNTYDQEIENLIATKIKFFKSHHHSHSTSQVQAHPTSRSNKNLIHHNILIEEDIRPNTNSQGQQQSIIIGRR
ncbi:hypothetical protein MJO29_016929 [Puccinia striiformis f. sp. tritici]|nr:hypothetical protein MJO29_016929 [Puccinia striiformis f. sp. tritici]